MPIQPVQFGKITVTSAHHYKHDGSDDFYIRLSGTDSKLSPVPSMGDKFRLKVHKDGSLTGNYEVLNEGPLGGQYDRADVPVKKEEILPLFRKMMTGATTAEWERLLASDNNATPLLRAVFPNVNFENQNGARHYNRFGEAFFSATQKTGLTETLKMPFYRHLWLGLLYLLPFKK